jgi:hypothetical protein
VPPQFWAMPPRCPLVVRVELVPSYEAPAPEAPAPPLGDSRFRRPEKNYTSVKNFINE